MLNSQDVYAHALRCALQDARTWLDLGCGHQFLPAWISEDRRRLPIGACQTVGLDADAASLRRHPDLRLRIVGTVEQLPLAAASFDLATANMVLEHVEHPELLFEEVSRVLKPGGIFLVHTPNEQGYTTRLTRCIPSSLRPRLANLLQGREEADVYPTFYRVNRVGELVRLAESVGLCVGDVRTIASSPQLYQVPVFRTVETWLLKSLERPSLARWRPCILGRFAKPRPPSGRAGRIT